MPAYQNTAISMLTCMSAQAIALPKPNRAATVACILVFFDPTFLFFYESVSSLEVRVGIDELLDVTVSVENREENSYNSRVILTYPAGLSYRKFTILQVRHQDQFCFQVMPHQQFLWVLLFIWFKKGRIECNSSDSEADLSRGKTDCTIDKPIFKSNKKVGSVYRRDSPGGRGGNLTPFILFILGFLHRLLWDQI